MAGAKHKVATDALETLGTVIPEGAGRDAIHLAVEPVIAAEKLYPGQDIGFVEGGVGNSPKPLGIVDPFLKHPVQPGQRFWLVLYPRTITALRHVWTHPSFADEGHATTADRKSESEEWLRNFAATNDCPDYHTLVSLALNHQDEGEGDGSEYLLVRGTDAHGSIPNEFWNHIEIVTGQKMTHRASYFSCSC